MKLSKQQHRLLKKLPVFPSEVNKDGNQRRTYLSLVNVGLAEWEDRGYYQMLRITPKGREALDGCN